MEHVAQVNRLAGGFLVEAAAVVRACTGLALNRLRFGDGDPGRVAVTAGPVAPVRLAVTSSRDEIARAIGVPPPAAGEPHGDPAVHPDPPEAVFAELLYDLGTGADVLTGYGPRPFVFVEIATDAERVTIDVADPAGVVHRTIDSLTSPVPPVATPYSIIDWIVAGKGAAQPGLVVFDRTRPAGSPSPAE